MAKTALTIIGLIVIGTLAVFMFEGAGGCDVMAAGCGGSTSKTITQFVTVPPGPLSVTVEIPMYAAAFELNVIGGAESYGIDYNQAVSTTKLDPDTHLASNELSGAVEVLPNATTVLIFNPGSQGEARIQIDWLSK